MSKSRVSPEALRIAFKIWLEFEGRPVLGEGGYRLLEKIDELGSIMDASKSLGISYRKAMAYLRKMEERLGGAVVETRRGGPGGGGQAHLTPLARMLMKRYSSALRTIEKALASVEAS
ncbi:MAG: ModE family transcriptional regulator [Thermoproteota archaeon]|nr:MAG: ModE family transcriptional regulator [Candidatus Korarchaeota archaeon]